MAASSAASAGPADAHPVIAPGAELVNLAGQFRFADPFYKRAWWEHTGMPQPSQQVYRRSPGRGELTRVTGNLSQPNGIKFKGANPGK